MEVMPTLTRMAHQPLQLWSKIRSDLNEILYTDDAIKQEFFVLSESKLGHNVKTGEEFFEALDNNFSEHCDVVEFVINLTEEIRLHVDDGATKMADTLRQYLQSLKDYDKELTSKGLGQKCFVGRQHELDLILRTIKYDECVKGILIHGMGGMGKTSLAVEGCRRLYIEDKWNVCKIDLREYSALRDLICNTLTKLGEKLSVSSTDQNADDLSGENQKYLKELLIRRCCDQTTNTVFFFDNIDDILEKDRNQFMLFTQQLLEKLPSFCANDDSQSKIRVLFTARKTLLDNSLAVKIIGTSILEVEIVGLEEKAAIDLFNTTSAMKSDPETVKKILSFCGNCPLAILSLCNSIRNSNITPDKLLLTFQMTQNETSAFDTFGVEACLKQSYERLDENLQQYLVMLFVFRTAKFDIDAASAIRGNNKKWGKANTCLDLVHLKSRHFVEMAFEDFSSGRSKFYCLHPLVVQFLFKKSQSEERSNALLDTAMNRFIEYFDGIVSSIALDFHAHPVESQKNLLENKIHIQNFFKYIIKSEGNLKHACVNLPKVVGEFRKDELCSFVLNDHERNEYYDQNINFAKLNEFVLDEIYWKTAKARLYFDIDRSDECDSLLSEIENIIKSKSIPSEGQVHAVLGMFYWMKGRLLNANNCCKDSLQCMEKSLSYYQKEPELCKTELANTYNSIGVIYYKQKEFERSEEYHKKAVEVENQVSQNEKDAIGINLQVYYTNIATALFAQWQKHAGSSVSEELNRHFITEAEDYYTLAINHDPKPSEDRAKKLTNRGKLYLVRKKFDAAEQDLLESLQIRESILVPPNVNLTLAYHNIGHLFIQKGQVPGTDAKTVADCFAKAANYYDEAKFQIERGGLAVTDPAYKTIVKNHKLALKVLMDERRSEQVKQFYQDFEAGKYSKKIKKCRSIDKTMTKSERLASTGKSFEGKSDSESDKSESEDESSSDSLSDQSSSEDITGDEECYNYGDDDFISDDGGLSDETSPQNAIEESQVSKETRMSAPDLNDGPCNKRRALPRPERETLDSGIDSLTSVPSEGSFTDTDDILSSKRKRLVSMASGGSLEDNVFTNCDK